MSIMDSIFSQFISELGDDPTRQGLVQTPARAAEAYQYLTSGYRENLQEILNGATFDAPHDELVVVKDIAMYSLCEHHLLPFFGRCHIGYLPKGKIIGISSLSKIVDHFARRLQVQENLTEEIAHCILEQTGGYGVGVIIEAQHLCMSMRGVNQHQATLTTSVTLGCFRDKPPVRQEFLSLVNLVKR